MNDTSSLGSARAAIGSLFGVKVRVCTTSSFITNLLISNATLESYKCKTKKGLASHPLLSSLHSCDSSEAILSVLREQIISFNQFQNLDDRLTNGSPQP